MNLLLLNVPKIYNKYYEMEQQILIQQEKIKTLTQNQQTYKDKIHNLSEKQKCIELTLEEKETEIKMLLNDKNKLLETSEQYKLENEQLSEKVTELLSQQIEEDNKPKHLRKMSLDCDYQDYDVKYEGKELGLSLCAIKDAKNCIVKKCLTHFATQNIEIGSQIVEIGGTVVSGLQCELIHNMLWQELKDNNSENPLIVTFRSKLDGTPYQQINNVNEKGILQITIVRCNQLKHAANYVNVSIGNISAQTEEIESDQNPEWSELMTFKNYRCDYGKNAMITVYGTSAIMKDKKIGSVEYELPVIFNETKLETLELKSHKGKLHGLIVLNVLLVPFK